MNISVIVPVYNVEKYIRECILSLLNQTLKDIEIIIVNDGSNDKSIERIDDLIKNNKNINLVNKVNGGLSSARNEGLKYATGEYVSFIDSDDYVEKDFLENLFNEAKRYDLDIAIGSHTRLYEDNTFIKVSRDTNLETGKVCSGVEFLSHQLELGDYRMEVWDDLYKRSFLIENNLIFNEKIIYEDELFTPQALISANKVKLIENYTYMYRQRNDSIMGCKITEKNIHSLSIILNELIFTYNISKEEKIKQILYKLIISNLFMLLEKIYLIDSYEKKHFYNKIEKKKLEMIIRENALNRKEKIRLFIFKFNIRLYYILLKKYADIK